MGQMITFQRPDGGHTQGYLADAGADATHQDLRGAVQYLAQ